MIKNIILGVLLASNLAYAVELGERTKLSLDYADDSKIHPNIFLPIKWNENFFTAIEYRTSFTKESGKIDIPNLTDSKQETELPRSVFKIHALSYQIGSVAVGIGYGQEVINKKQSGYFDTATSHTTFNNKVDITYSSVFLKVDSTHKDTLSWLDFRIGLVVLPAPKLKVEQKTSYSVNTFGFLNSSGSSTETTDVMYEITFNSRTDTGLVVDMGLDLYYQYLPLQYDLILADGTTKPFDIEEVITEASLLLHVNVDIAGLSPHVGYKIETTQSSGSIEGTQTENIFFFGLEKMF